MQQRYDNLYAAHGFMFIKENYGGWKIQCICNYNFNSFTGHDEYIAQFTSSYKNFPVKGLKVETQKTSLHTFRSRVFQRDELINASHHFWNNKMFAGCGVGLCSGTEAGLNRGRPEKVV